MKNDKIWNIILLISVIMLIHGMSNSGDSDKKTAQVAQGETIAGASGAVVSMLGKKGFLAAIAAPAIWAIAALIFLAPQWIGNWANLFNPAPSIPIWVWVVGFGLLFIMLTKRN